MNTNLGNSTNPANNYALIIGISHYRDDSISNLSHTKADAQSFHDLLINPRRVGFPEENVKLLLDEDATRFAIEDAVCRWLRSHAKPSSKVVVFFAGHGSAEHDHSGEDESITYMLPHDACANNLFASSISTGRFQKLLASVHSERLVTFLDACHSGAFEVQGARRVAVKPACYSHLGKGKGRVLIAAAQANQFSFEDDVLGHGIFTHHLMEALSGKADYDNDGRVTIQEVFKYLAEHVPETVRKLGKQGVQEPLMEGVTTRDIVLAIDPERIQKIETETQRREEEKKNQYRARIRMLSDLRADGQLSVSVFHEATMLLESEPENLDRKQKRLLANLLSLLNGGMNSYLYLGNREAILGQEDPLAKEAAAGEDRVEPHPEPHPPELPMTPAAKNQFCIHCGAPSKPIDSFCTQCGRQIDD